MRSAHDSPKRNIDRIVATGVPASALERALGLSAGYLSKVRHGAVTTGGQLEILLALLARHPMLLRELGVPAAAPRSRALRTTRAKAKKGGALALVLRIAGALDDAGVTWAVGGAVALAAHGLPRATADVDIFVRDEHRNALAVLRAAGASVGTLGAQTFVAYAKGTVAAADRVDIVFATHEPLKSAVRRADRLRIGDVDVPVLRAVDLCAAKLLSHAPHDAVDAAALIAAGLVDVGALRRVLSRVPASARGDGRAAHFGDKGAARARLRGAV